MRHLILVLLAALLLPTQAFAQPAIPDETGMEFDALAELGALQKPRVKIKNSKDAFDFIMADTIVRADIEKFINRGYNDFSAKAQLLGYDGDEAIWEVRITATTMLPPYSCHFRFDSVGNDRRDPAWPGCEYE